MHDPRGLQARFNRESAGQWDGFEGHRRRVTAELGQGAGRLCVLGAGNANDLSLTTLLETYREVHLGDLDGEALARGVERQGVAGRQGLRLHGNLDLTAMLDAMARWSPLATVAPAELEAMAEWPAARVGLALPGPFDVVASTCLLSQIVGNAQRALGEGHPQLDRVAGAIRLGHLRLLASLARPGGRVVLITDVASSDWVAGLADAPDAALPGILDGLASGPGAIRGVHPADLVRLLRADPQLEAVERSKPWRWRLHARVYLCMAITGRRR
jgi:hypothetical protein